MKNDIEIKPFSVEDFSFVLELSEQLLGANYINKEILESFLLTKSGIVAFRKSDRVGVLFWNAQLPSNLVNRYKDINAVYLQTIIINPEKQKQGIGLKLITDFTKRFTDKLIVAQAWSVKNHCNAERLNLKAGFIKVKSEGKIWQTDCESGLFNCPSYQGKCSCEAVLFEKCAKDISF